MVYETSQFHLFPFNKVRYGAEIVIYGYGVIGRQYVEQIKKTKYCKIKYIVDNAWERLENCYNIRIVPPEQLEREKNITVVIATTRYQTEIKDLLFGIGFSADNIVSADIEMDAYAYNIFEGVSKKERDYLRQFREKISIKQAKGIALTRVGRDNDGGYLMLDAMEGGIAYSFGICDDVSWDSEMATKEYDIYMYDHTIEGLPYYDKHFHWYKKGLAGRSSEDQALKTITELMAENGHEKKTNLILKMDIEGGEWDFLEYTSQDVLEKFDQMIFELHGCLNYVQGKRILNCLDKINKTHQCVHVHANNIARNLYVDGVPYADCIEVTYAQKGKYIFETTQSELPHFLDQPNNYRLPEVRIGRYYNFE